MSLDKQDRWALAAIAIAGASCSIGALFFVRWIGVNLLQVLSFSNGGVGYRSAFIASLCIASPLIVMFAVVSGDGIIGELPTVLLGYIALIVFFTVAIAIIL